MSEKKEDWGLHIFAHYHTGYESCEFIHEIFHKEEELIKRIETLIDAGADEEDIFIIQGKTEKFIVEYEKVKQVVLKDYHRGKKIWKKEEKKK